MVYREVTDTEEPNEQDRHARHQLQLAQVFHHGFQDLSDVCCVVVGKVVALERRPSVSDEINHVDGNYEYTEEEREGEQDDERGDGLLNIVRTLLGKTVDR